MARSSLKHRKGATRPIVRDVGQDDLYAAVDHMVLDAANLQAPNLPDNTLGAGPTSGVRIKGGVGGGTYNPIVTSNQR